MNDLVDVWFSLWIGRFITAWVFAAGLAMTIGFIVPKIINVFLHIFNGHPTRFMAFMIVTMVAAVFATLSDD